MNSQAIQKVNRPQLTAGPQANYEACELDDVDGSNREFADCTFDYSVITRGYFFKAKFRNCSFVGAIIEDSSFRSATFVGCDFKFCRFNRTVVPVAELLTCLPDWPNVRRELLQNLRANALSLGDTEHINLLVWHELQAERLHYRKARERNEKYYRDHYSSTKAQLRIWWHSIKLWSDLFFWGHGESLSRLVISTTVILLTAAALSTLYGLPDLHTSATGTVADLVKNRCLVSLALFLDLPGDYNQFVNEHFLYSSFMLFLRYVSLGLFVAILFKKISRR